MLFWKRATRAIYSHHSLSFFNKKVRFSVFSSKMSKTPLLKRANCSFLPERIALFALQVKKDKSDSLPLDKSERANAQPWCAACYLCYISTLSTIRELSLSPILLYMTLPVLHVSSLIIFPLSLNSLVVILSFKGTVSREQLLN